MPFIYVTGFFSWLRFCFLKEYRRKENIFRWFVQLREQPNMACDDEAWEADYNANGWKGGKSVSFRFPQF